MMKRGSEVKSRIGMGNVFDGVFVTVDGVGVIFQLGRYGHSG